MLELFQKDTDKRVFEDNMLFATLETSTRRITLKESGPFLLMDTVGFISQLPHHLVKAFHSTLEEVNNADLLLHVIDISNPDHEKQMEVTEDTLEQIGAAGIPVINVFNKIDMTELKYTTMEHSKKIYISARNKIGLDKLIKNIESLLFGQFVLCKMLIPYQQGSILSYIIENAYIKAVKYQNDGTLLTLKCHQRDYQRYRQYIYNENNTCLKTKP